MAARIKTARITDVSAVRDWTGGDRRRRERKEETPDRIERFNDPEASLYENRSAPTGDTRRHARAHQPENPNRPACLPACLPPCLPAPLVQFRSSRSFLKRVVGCVPFTAVRAEGSEREKRGRTAKSLENRAAGVPPECARSCSALSLRRSTSDSA